MFVAKKSAIALTLVLVLFSVLACERESAERSSAERDWNESERPAPVLPAGHRTFVEGIDVGVVLSSRVPRVVKSPEMFEELLKNFDILMPEVVDAFRQLLDDRAIDFSREVIVFFPAYSYTPCFEDVCTGEEITAIDAYIVDTAVTEGQVQINNRMFALSSFDHYDTVVSTADYDEYFAPVKAWVAETESADGRLITDRAQLQALREKVLAGQAHTFLTQKTRRAFDVYILNHYPFDFSEEIVLAAFVPSDGRHAIFELNDRVLSPVSIDDRALSPYSYPTNTDRSGHDGDPGKRFVLMRIDRHNVDAIVIDDEVLSWETARP